MLLAVINKYRHKMIAVLYKVNKYIVTKCYLFLGNVIII